MAMSQADIRNASMRYYELLRGGVPAADAFKQAFPNGLPTAEDKAKAAAKSEQKGAIASLGGLAAGALGVQAVSDAVSDKPILGGIGSKIAGWFGGGGDKATGTLTSSTTTPAAPVILGAERVLPDAGQAAMDVATGEGASSIGGQLLPGAGAALSAYGLFKANQSKSPLLGALSGAGLGSSVAALAGLGPLAAAPLAGGALVGALTGGIGKIGDRDAYKDEYKRAQALRDSGVNWGFNPQELSSGRSREQLINPSYARDFVGSTPNGFVNNKFAGSRAEGDLRPEDVVGYSFLPEAFGNSYANAGLDKKLQVADALLGAGAVREHHGQMDFNQNYNQSLQDKIQSILGNAPAAQQAPLPASRPLTPQELAEQRRLGQGLAAALARG